MAAHFSPSCLGLMGKFYSSVDLLFQVLFSQVGHWWSNLDFFECNQHLDDVLIFGITLPLIVHNTTT